MLRSVAALLVAATPHLAGAIEWAGRFGLDYTRDDRWLQSGERETFPRLDLSLAFDVNGFISRPDIVSYVAAVDYRRLDRSYPGESTVQKALKYRGQLHLLRGQGNPFQLDLLASRADESFTVTGATSGAALTTTWGAYARYTEPERPQLQLGYTRSASEMTGRSVADSNRTLQVVTGAIAEGTATFSYNGRYQGNFSDGTYVTDQYADHRVDLEARTQIGPTWRVAVNDSYYRRDPDATAAVNARQEYNSVSANVRNEISRTESQTFNYRYFHGIQEAPTTATIERSGQRLQYQLRKDLRDPDWRVLATADVSQAQDRLGSTQETGTGETAGAVFYWRKKSSPGIFELRGGPSVGYVQPLRSDSFFGYGAVAGVFYETRLDPATVQISYGLDFRDDLRTEGRSFTQSLSANASRPIRSGLATASIMGSSTRIDQTMYGDQMARSITADASYRWSTFGVHLQAGLTDSVNAALNEAVSGDGLILAPYDTHSRYVILDGSAAVTRSIHVTGQFRVGSSDIPDRPSFMETEGRAGIEFNYGALRLALEERLTVTSVTGQDMRINLFMVRIYRAFGSRL